ncbi:hypothetical protein [Desulfuribacillus alkaliarsenatis]|uniref:hypothetical protein n=1 Tax=Desulfuribacillus alkaliarsenatis TaxID=766136 RepID=UPI00159EFFE1|nr:hypothetical protein [Desulfuribacillus alkaliarsenatis]
MSFQNRKKNKVLRKSIGLVIAVIGLGILANYLPGWIWPLVAGVGLISLGWVMYNNA